MNQSRRVFLRRMGIGLGSGALLSAIDNFSLTSAFAQGAGYRALVCIFLGGGNDGNNTLIPNDNAGWNRYFNERNPAGLAHARARVLPITPNTLGIPFAMHPNMGPLHTLWGQGRVAFVTNVGPLIRPLHTSPGQTPRQRYNANPNLRPLQLFSHADQVQQWQTAAANGGTQSGWGGRTADQFPPHGSGFPMVTSIAGNARFTVGTTRQPLILAPANNNGQTPNLGSVLALNGFGNDPEGPSRRAALDNIRNLDTNSPFLLRGAAANLMDQALRVGTALANANVNLSTAFPNTDIGNQLLQVARTIKANRTAPELGLTHQIFFVHVGGFDTHRNQNDPNRPNSQIQLLTRLSNAMAAFYNATVELGVADRVTQFTLSDFGRTFHPANSGATTVGTDHAWGNHMWVVGGSVRGRDFYGSTYSGTPYGLYPDLVKGGALDTDNRGRWIPTTAVDQYANTLAKWFGLPQDSATLRAVFPLLESGGFAPFDLGFLRPLV